MRVLVHDYSGHPFQVQLSRALARRGHETLHVHCSSYATGKGAVDRQSGDPEEFSVLAIDLGTVFDRYSFGHRVRQELAYGKSFVQHAASWRPDVILSSNDPLFAKARAGRWCRTTRTPWVFWLQDVYSVAMARYAETRLGRAGRPIGRGFQRIERRLLREASAVVAITEDFGEVLRAWGVRQSSTHVIENWAPLEELGPMPKDNDWSRQQRLADRPVFLYSGTLGLKHSPEVLVRLAERVAPAGAVMVVVSEGSGADWLEQQQRQRRLDNLVLLPYQPFERLPEVLASADVLMTLLDREAGAFSVPSKILTYLCAGRPLLAAMPDANLGSRTIRRAGAGIVVNPDDVEGLLAGADTLLADEELRRHCGTSARSYAERTFDIEAITDRFEAILTTAAAVPATA